LTQPSTTPRTPPPVVQAPRSALRFFIFPPSNKSTLPATKTVGRPLISRFRHKGSSLHQQITVRWPWCCIGCQSEHVIGLYGAEQDGRHPHRTPPAVSGGASEERHRGATYLLAPSLLATLQPAPAVCRINSGRSLLLAVGVTAQLDSSAHVTRIRAPIPMIHRYPFSSPTCPPPLKQPVIWLPRSAL